LRILGILLKRRAKLMKIYNQEVILIILNNGGNCCEVKKEKEEYRKRRRKRVWRKEKDLSIKVEQSIT
jgi:hypothetical protein